MNTNEKPIGYVEPHLLNTILFNFPWKKETIYSTSSNKGTIPVYTAPDPWNTALNLFLTARAINDLFDEKNK